jgi:uncharacterized membrane protein YhaH (DUF805 family)
VLRQDALVASLKAGYDRDMRDLDSDGLRWLVLGLDGRISRRTWWMWGVAVPLGLGLYLTVLLRVTGLSAHGTEVAVNLLLLWPTLAVSVKRWHDRDKSGWWVLAALIPVVGWIWVLIENGLLRGSIGANRFGAPQQPPVNTGP